MTGGDPRPQCPAISWFSVLRDNGNMPIDDVLAAAVEPARRAILESADPTEVGDHLGARSEGEHLIVHLFGSQLPGYRGWYWAVSMSRAPASSHVTVNEVVLLPGDESISAPEWTPYKQRVEPGDLQPGDVLPPEPNDARLVPAWSAGESDAHPGDIATAREHAFGRKVVLSRQGRLDAADRWYSGSQGPDSPLAKQAPGRCHTCGFLVRLAGPLGGAFGVCANGMANDDGRVVALNHGCGAHSGVPVAGPAERQELPEPILDTVGVDVVEAW